MAPAPAGVHVPLRFLRAMVKKGSNLLRQRVFAGAEKTTARTFTREFAPAYARINSTPASPFERIKFGKRWYTTQVRSFLRSIHGDATVQKAASYAHRPSYTPVRNALRTASPFASALRPRLTGGAMPRTAGGYSLGGNGARMFSHSPTAPAQVIQQVSQAIRAFVLSGEDKYAEFRRSNGTMGRLGVRALIASNLTASNAPGSYIDFDLAPTFTSLSPLSRDKSLENSAFLNALSSDFATMVTDITATYADIQRLSKLGDLPITMEGEKGDILRVHFPGCEKDFVERLVAELDISRGIVHEDERFTFGASMMDVEMFQAVEKKIEWKDMLSESSSVWSEDGEEDAECISPGEFDSEFEDVESLQGSQYFSDGPRSTDVDVRDFEGLVGVYRFMNEYGDGQRSGYI